MIKAFSFSFAALLLVASVSLRAQTFDEVSLVHPSWTLSQLRPNGWNVQVTGMDFLPDGKLVVLEMSDPAENTTNNPRKNGRLFVVSNLSSTDPEKITYVQVADTLREPVGVLVKDGKIYVSEKNELNEYTLNAEETKATKTKTIATIPHDKSGNVNFQEYAFGLIYKSGYFYIASAGPVHQGGWAFDGNAIADLSEEKVGCVIKISEVDGSVTKMNAGMRANNGIGWGPEGTIWITDNQGSYRPSSQLTLSAEGKNYGYPVKAGLYTDGPVTPPSLWLPHGDISRSPTAPLLISHGLYGGQFLVGDLSQGGIKRAFVEKVGNDWQGAAFSFTGGLEVGIEKMLELPDGTLYVGGLGRGDQANWGWAGKTFGLQKLTPKPGVVTFEMLALRSRAKGMEIEFTKPVGPEGEVKTNYSVKSATMNPQSGYGAGNMENQKDISIKTITVSSDRKKVFLEMDLVAKTVLVVKTVGVKSQAAESVRCPAAWYTLNAISITDPFSTTTTTSTHTVAPAFNLRFKATEAGVEFSSPFSGVHEVSVKTLSGRVLSHEKHEGTHTYELSSQKWGHGVFLLEYRAAGKTVKQNIVL